MNYRIRITRRAQQDMDHAADYIEFSLKNANAAEALLEEAAHVISGLSQMPERYALADDDLLASWGIRFVRIKNFLAFYRVDRDASTVVVVRFLYGKRNWKSILRHDLRDLDSL